MIDLSAIILTCNRPARCLESVRHNALSMAGMNAETIVINNGSAPLSLPTHHGDIPCQVIQMPSNQGAAARNAGIKVASGKYLIVLDDDAFIEPSHLHALMHGFESTPAAGAYSFPVRNATDDEGCMLPTIFHGCACGFRKKALIDAGGYPTDYLYYGEEYEVAFRLYAKGYSILRGIGGAPVRHERDPGGRDKTRIIKLLIQNNVHWIWTHFAARLITGASRDILQRYRCVASKENVLPGYQQGLRAIPGAILRGLLHRQPMPPELLRKALLLEPLARTCLQLHSARLNEVVLCGTGKFPSLWLNQLRQQNIQPKAILDLNPCWAGQSICRIPVITDPQEISALLNTGIPALVGSASLPENEQWIGKLKSKAYLPITSPHTPEYSSAPGNFDLLNDCKISAWRPNPPL